MALRFVDSFDHYATADRLKKWTLDAGSGTLAISATQARFGSALQKTTATTPNKAIVKTIDSQQTWVVGFAYYFDGAGNGTEQVVALLDTATIQVDVRLLSASNVLRVTRGSTTLATGTTVLSQNTWYYIEFKAKIDNTTGTYEVRINGVQEAALTATGVDTQNSANATANQIQLGSTTGGGGNSMGGYFDDLYVCDTSGATNNDFLGDCRVEALFPNGNGNSSQWTGSDGNSTDNYLLVDEATPNDDTDYVASSTTTQKDTYTFTNPTPTSGTVYGVQVLQYARKTDAGARSIASVARLSGTEVDSSNEALSTSYTYYADVRETKPGGGSWSLTDVANAEFGPKLTV